MEKDWKHELVAAVDLSGVFAAHQCEKQSARNALCEALATNINFDDYIKEVEKAVEQRIRVEVPGISEARLKNYRDSALAAAARVDTYFG